MKQIAAIGSDCSQFVVELLDFWKNVQAAQGFDAPPVHDPCAVAYVIDPNVMTTQKVPVNIELTGTHTLGMTVADFRHPAPENCHTQVAVKLDHHKLAVDYQRIKNIG